MRLLNTLSIVAALAFALPAAAATQIKIATIAPDGTAWMKEMRAAGDAIRKATDDRVELKFYPELIVRASTGTAPQVTDLAAHAATSTTPVR